MNHPQHRHPTDLTSDLRSERDHEMTKTFTYREIPLGSCVCPVCDETVPVLRDAKKPRQLFRHGPVGDRCAGSHESGLEWIEGAGLPQWDDMSDLDKGCALMFVWKVHWERDYSYAREHYPATYRDSEVLRSLDTRTACRHAWAVCRGHQEIQDRIGDAEHERLYGLALFADRDSRRGGVE